MKTDPIEKNRVMTNNLKSQKIIVPFKDDQKQYLQGESFSIIRNKYWNRVNMEKLSIEKKRVMGIQLNHHS